MANAIVLLVDACAQEPSSWRQLRSALLGDPRLASIPVVVVTALEPADAAGLSVLKVFRKPLDVEALLTVVRENC